MRCYWKHHTGSSKPPPAQSSMGRSQSKETPHTQASCPLCCFCGPIACVLKKCISFTFFWKKCVYFPFFWNPKLATRTKLTARPGQSISMEPKSRKANSVLNAHPIPHPHPSLYVGFFTGCCNAAQPRFHVHFSGVCWFALRVVRMHACSHAWHFDPLLACMLV